MNEIFSHYPPALQESHNIIMSHAILRMSESDILLLNSELFLQNQFFLAAKIARETNNQIIINKTKENIREEFSKWIAILLKEVWSKPRPIKYWRNKKPNKYSFFIFKELHHSVLHMHLNATDEFQKLFNENHHKVTDTLFKHSFHTLFQYETMSYIDQSIDMLTGLEYSSSNKNIPPFYFFLRKLCFSDKLFSIQENTLSKVISVRQKILQFESSKVQHTWYSLACLIYIDFIVSRKKILTEAVNKAISKNLKNIPKSHRPIDLFNLLDKFEYSYHGYDWAIETNNLIERVITPRYIFQYDKGKLELITNEYNKMLRYLKTVEKWTPFLIFHIEKLTKKDAIFYIDLILNISSKVQELFNTHLPFFEAYNSFQKIELPAEGTNQSTFVEGRKATRFDVSKFNKVQFKRENINTSDGEDIFEKIKNNLNFSTRMESKFIDANSGIYIIKGLYPYYEPHFGSVRIHSIDNKVVWDRIIELQLTNSFNKFNIWLIEILISRNPNMDSWEKHLMKIGKFLGLYANKSNLLKNVDDLNQLEEIIKKYKSKFHKIFFDRPRVELVGFNQLLDHYKNDEKFEGLIKSRTNGGMFVDAFGFKAFLPGSQIDVKPIRDYDSYVGKQMEFKVVKINEEFRNVVVSHKALIEAELEEQKKQIISGLEKGQVLEGIVKNITSYGAFIDLGGVDGLIHITDISWGRVSHPEEMLELDSKINVVILDFDDEKKRIALGLKQLQPHPWDSLDAELAVGDKVSGKVVVMADYGAFIEIAAGVEGLIHVSEMSWSQHLRSAQDFMKIGDSVEAVVLTLDREERNMTLGIKQLMPDPWSNIYTKYAVNTQHTAKVRNFTKFGVFVELEEGIDGLIHISDLSWQKKIKHPSEFCKTGEAMEVIVLEIDQENRRISLSHKEVEKTMPPSKKN